MELKKNNHQKTTDFAVMLFRCMYKVDSFIFDKVIKTIFREIHGCLNTILFELFWRKYNHGIKIINDIEIMSTIVQF